MLFVRICAVWFVLFGVLQANAVQGGMAHPCRTNIRQSLTTLGVLSGFGLRYRIGGFELLDLIQQVETVSFIELNTFVKPETATRWAAFSVPTTRTVYLNEDAPISVLVRPTLCMHEFFQIVGIEDADYQLSTLIHEYIHRGQYLGLEFSKRDPTMISWSREIARASFTSQPLPSPLSLRQDPRSANSVLRLSRGGGDLVGGGGDGLGAEFKRALFVHVFRSGLLVAPEERDVADLLNLPLEISNGEQVVFEGVDSKHRLGTRILVPGHLAVLALAQQKDGLFVMDDLAYFLKSVSDAQIFRARSNPFVCFHPASLSYWRGGFVLPYPNELKARTCVTGLITRP